MRTAAGLLIITLVAAAAAACGPGGTPTDGSTGAPAIPVQRPPTPFPVEGAPAGIASPTPDEPSPLAIANELGFALVPAVLPKDFTLEIAEVLRFPAAITARQLYVSGGTGSISPGAGGGLELHVTYPMRFTPNGDSFFEEAGFQVPDDVMDPIAVGSVEAYVIRGGWDPKSMRIMQPYLARWDYERSLTIMFVFEDTPAGPVWVSVRAENKPAGWITVAELVRIAESIERAP